MKIIKGNYGEVRFCDNMNPEFGLPSLREKSWDLCLTDPPYNIKFKTSSSGCNKNKIFYEDDNPQYFEWCWKWFDSLKKSTNMVVFSCGYKNRNEWFRKDNFELLYWYNKSRQGGNTISYLNKMELYLVYGITNPRLKWNVIDYNLDLSKEINTLHPCPKPVPLIKRILKEINPLSVIDIFLGSGTTAQCCEEMGIPWLGYEIMEEYSPDIEKRIQLGIKAHDSYIRSKKVQKRLEI